MKYRIFVSIIFVLCSCNSTIVFNDWFREAIAPAVEHSILVSKEVLLYTDTWVKKYEGKKECIEHAFSIYKDSTYSDDVSYNSVDDDKSIDNVFENIIVLSYEPAWSVDILNSDFEIKNSLDDKYSLKPTSECSVLVYYNYRLPCAGECVEEFILCFDFADGRFKDYKIKSLM